MQRNHTYGGVPVYCDGLLHFGEHDIRATDTIIAFEGLKLRRKVKRIHDFVSSELTNFGSNPGNIIDPGMRDCIRVPLALRPCTQTPGS